MEAFVRPTTTLSHTSFHSSHIHPAIRRVHSVPRRRLRSARHTHVCPTSCSANPDSEPSVSRHHNNGFVLWGPPGSGKSTLCETLSRTHGLVHISTGSLLRAHVLYNTSWGVKARPFVRSSQPVPDDIVIPIVLQRLTQKDVAERSFILDGFPRNAVQHAALSEAGFSYSVSFMLHAPRDTLERRIKYRRLDPETDILYNLKLRPTDSQEVLERLVILDKDRRGNVAELFAAFGRSTADMYDLLASKAVRIDADRPFQSVLRDIVARLEAYGIRRQSPLEEPQPAVKPRMAMPPHLLGRANAHSDTLDPSGPPYSPASAAAAMRAMSALPQLRTPELDSEKSPITLIRCDGYVCERESVEGSNITFRGAATEQVMLVWNRRPSTVLLLVKKDPELMGKVLEAAKYLMTVEKLTVIVEPQVQTEALANGVFLETFSSSASLHDRVDFVVCLGGDGLILHVSTLFSTAVPPVISFNLGSLGFLTPFQFENFKTEVREVVKGNCNLSLRMRLNCGIVRENRVQREFQVLNEVVIDRGSSPYLSNLDCYCDQKYITTVQADGIIMSTPTGSTAYSMSAGGSMVHPSVPAILFTPICPHSLSFRPIVFPDAAKLCIEISEDARSHAWASFDGKSRQQMRRGDGLLVEMSLYPVPTINKTDHTGDWFQSLDRAFNFNSRAIQKRLPDLVTPARSSLSLIDENGSDSSSTLKGEDELVHDEGVEKQMTS